MKGSYTSLYGTWWDAKEVIRNLMIQHDSALPVIWPNTCSDMLIPAELVIQLDKATVFLKQGCDTDRE